MGIARLTAALVIVLFSRLALDVQAAREAQLRFRVNKRHTTVETKLPNSHNRYRRHRRWEQAILRLAVFATCYDVTYCSYRQ